MGGRGGVPSRGTSPRPWRGGRRRPGGGVPVPWRHCGGRGGVPAWPGRGCACSRCTSACRVLPYHSRGRGGPGSASSRFALTPLAKPFGAILAAVTLADERAVTADADALQPEADEAVLPLPMASEEGEEDRSGARRCVSSTHADHPGAHVGRHSDHRDMVQLRPGPGHALAVGRPSTTPRNLGEPYGQAQRYAVAGEGQDLVPDQGV
jgi:hypothetical protein